MIPVGDFAIFAMDLGVEREVAGIDDVTAEGADFALEFVSDEQHLVLEAFAPGLGLEVVFDVGKILHRPSWQMGLGASAACGRKMDRVGGVSQTRVGPRGIPDALSGGDRFEFDGLVFLGNGVLGSGVFEFLGHGFDHLAEEFRVGFGKVVCLGGVFG